jgi:hypothetical protein
MAAGPTYDFSLPGAATSRGVAESALNGTIAALEPNIVDDGSTDGTGAVVVDPASARSHPVRPQPVNVSSGVISAGSCSSRQFSQTLRWSALATHPSSL